MSETGFSNVLCRYVYQNWCRIILTITLAVIFITVVFFYGFKNDLPKIVKLIDLLYSSIINLVIFLPSIAFVSFGLLPSVGKNLKIKLIEKGEYHGRKIEGVMDDLAIVFYFSVLAIGLSIAMKMLWASLNVDDLNNLNTYFYNTLFISSFSIGFSVLLLILERIWMIINTIHSILLGDFSSVQKDFDDIKSLIENGEIKNINLENTINRKVEENLQASSVESLRRRIKPQNRKD